MAELMKIDAHVHVFTTDMPLIDNPRHAPTYSFSHADLIATLDANGVDRAVIAAASPWGDYNDYTWTALRAHGKRLRGTAIFSRPMERSALEAMRAEGAGDYLRRVTEVQLLHGAARLSVVGGGRNKQARANVVGEGARALDGGGRGPGGMLVVVLVVLAAARKTPLLNSKSPL